MFKHIYPNNVSAIQRHCVAELISSSTSVVKMPAQQPQLLLSKHSYDNISNYCRNSYDINISNYCRNNIALTSVNIISSIATCHFSLIQLSLYQLQYHFINFSTTLSTSIPLCQLQYHFVNYSTTVKFSTTLSTSVPLSSSVPLCQLQ